jgi:hypothetical protein
MRTAVGTLILFFTFTQEGGQEPPEQPHTNDPAQCTSYCHPKGVNTRPKGTPEGIPGYECQGDHCAKAADEGGENPCDEHGNERKCTKWCAKPCCTCLAVCI